MSHWYRCATWVSVSPRRTVCVFAGLGLGTVFALYLRLTARPVVVPPVDEASTNGFAGETAPLSSSHITTRPNEGGTLTAVAPETQVAEAAPALANGTLVSKWRLPPEVVVLAALALGCAICWYTAAPSDAGTIGIEPLPGAASAQS